MTLVRMVYDMPRTVRDWPAAGEVYEASEEEAANLVQHDWAEYVDSDEYGPLYEEPEDDDLEYDGPDEPEDDDFGYGVSDSDGDSDVEEEHRRPPRSEIVKKPRTVDPKSKWLQYARSKGYTGDDTITKNRLIAEYGD